MAMTSASGAPGRMRRRSSCSSAPSPAGLTGGWTEWDWARLCGSGAEEFLAARTLPTERTVRPVLVALGYLLGGFTSFQHLGNFNRLHLACLGVRRGPGRGVDPPGCRDS